MRIPAGQSVARPEVTRATKEVANSLKYSVVKATLGDPDSSPEEKEAQLDAFIESKIRRLEGLKRKTGRATAEDDDVALFDKYGI